MQSTQPKLWNKNFVCITVATLIMAIAFYFMLPILPVFLKDFFNANSLQVGIAMASYSISAIFIRPFIGYALDTYGRFPIYILSFILFSLLFLGYPWAFSIAFVIFIRFAHGLIWGGITTSGSTIVVDIIPPQRRGEGIGLYGLSMTIAMAIGPMLALVISGENNFKRLFFSAFALSSIGLLLALMVKVPSMPRKVKKFTLAGLYELKAIPLGLNLFLAMIPYGGVITFISLYGKVLGIENSGWYFMLLSAGIAFSRFFGGRIYDRFGPRKIVSIGLLLIMVGFLVIALLQNSIGFHFSAPISGFGFGLIMPTFQAMCNHNVPTERRGAANSTYLTFLDLGIGVGMLVFGFLIDKIDYSGTFLVAAGIELIAVLLFIAKIMPYFRRNAN